MPWINVDAKMSSSDPNEAITGEKATQKTSQLGSAVRSHAVVTKTVATTQKLQFTHTHTGREINCNQLSR
jgi:hypothetical protein